MNYKVGKESAQYRGPVIWNFIARLANFNVNIQKDSFKNILRRLSQNINSFLFEAHMIAMKDRDFVTYLPMNFILMIRIEYLNTIG